MVIVWLMSTWPNNKNVISPHCAALPKSDLFIYFSGPNKSIILQQQQPVKSTQQQSWVSICIIKSDWNYSPGSALTGRKWKWPYTYLSLVAICQGYNDRVLWMMWWCPGRITQWFHQTTEQLVNYLTKQTRGRGSVLKVGLHVFSCHLML